MTGGAAYFLCWSSNTLVHQRIKVCIPYQLGLKGITLSLMSYYCHSSLEIITLKFLGLVLPSLVGFFHGLNFSVCFSVSSTNVWLPVLALTFTTRRTASSGRSQVKNPFSKFHFEFRDLAMVSKIYIEHNIIPSCLLPFLIIVICNTKVSRFGHQTKPGLTLFKHNEK